MKFLKSFNENLNAAKSIISKKMAAFDKLKVLLSKNMGYIGKFTEYLMDENISYNDLESLYKGLISIKNKGVSIDIQSLKYEQLIDKIQSSENDVVVRQFINQFPSLQKGLAKTIISSNSNKYNAFLQAAKKDNTERFLGKISRYRDEESLLNAVKLFSKDAVNNRDKITEFVESSENSEIVYSSDQILIVRVDKIEDIQKLGSDTSWCILRQGMWDSYTKNRFQYILYDFNKDEYETKFKIGFTLNKNLTIHAAHDIIDTGASDYLTTLLNDNSIKLSSLLKEKPKAEYNIDISKVGSKTTIGEWVEISTNCNKEHIPIAIDKLIKLSGLKLPECDTYKLTDSKKKVLKTLVERYYHDSEYVIQSDIAKMNECLSVLVSKSSFPVMLNKLILNKRASSILSPDALKVGLTIWDNEAMANGILNDTSFISRYYDYEKEELRIDRETFTKIADKILECVPLIDNFSQPYQKNVIKNAIVTSNFILDRPEKIPAEIKNSISDSLKENKYKLFKLPFEITSVHPYSSNDNWSDQKISLIEKKDYDKISCTYKAVQLGLMTKIVNHLKGHKVNIRISKDTIKEVKMNLRNSNDPFTQLVCKFPDRLLKTTTVNSEDGNVKIEFY